MSGETNAIIRQSGQVGINAYQRAIASLKRRNNVVSHNSEKHFWVGRTDVPKRLTRSHAHTLTHKTQKHRHSVAGPNIQAKQTKRQDRLLKQHTTTPKSSLAMHKKDKRQNRKNHLKSHRVRQVAIFFPFFFFFLSSNKRRPMPHEYPCKVINAISAMGNQPTPVLRRLTGPPTERK